MCFTVAADFEMDEEDGGEEEEDEEGLEGEDAEADVENMEVDGTRLPMQGRKRTVSVM